VEPLETPREGTCKEGTDEVMATSIVALPTEDGETIIDGELENNPLL
jgi:hypothetical protein